MTTNNSIKKIISIIKSELKEYYPSTEIDSFINLIFENVLNYSRTKLLISLENDISSEVSNKIDHIINELKSYKPIQYILGNTSFYNLYFKIRVGVLIPRPETEELVDWIISENKNKNIKILDIGTGSGCIAITLSKYLPNSTVSACDVSKEALLATIQNSNLNNATVSIKHLDILNTSETIIDKFDIIVSNPPYIRESEKRLMHKNVLDYEPELALFVPDKNPLLFYKAVTEFGLKHLNSKGKIYFEINEAFGKETSLLLHEYGYEDIILKKDINGKDRMLKATLK